MEVDRNNAILVMSDSGMSYGNIAKALGVTRCAVAGVVHRNKIKCENRTKRKATVPVVANSKPCKKMSKVERNEIIVSMLNDGKSYKHICDKIGCSRPVITYVARENASRIKNHGNRYKKRIPVSCDGIEYGSMNKAARSNDIGPGTLKHRLESPNFPDWLYIDGTTNTH